MNIQVCIEEQLGEPLIHSYNISDNEEGSCTLFKTNDTFWSEWCRGKESGYLIDNGGGIEVKVGGMKAALLQYHEAQELLALLLHNNDCKIELREVSVLKSVQ